VKENKKVETKEWWIVIPLKLQDFSNDELKLSTDNIEPSDTLMSGAILQDFTFFTNI